MARKKTVRKKPVPQQPSEENRADERPDLEGPPPQEMTNLPTDEERAFADHLREEAPAETPLLSGGDVDADWEHAGSVGEEAVGGTVATPDQDNVDELNDAMGVPRAPDDEFKPSSEILDARDRYRAEENT